MKTDLEPVVASSSSSSSSDAGDDMDGVESQGDIVNEESMSNFERCRGGMSYVEKKIVAGMLLGVGLTEIFARTYCTGAWGG